MSLHFQKGRSFAATKCLVAKDMGQSIYTSDRKEERVIWR
jgi:hypothetical protein